MRLDLIAQDSKTGSVYDMSELVKSGATWETNMEDQPGKLTFDYIDQESIILNEGSAISLKIDDIGIFFGYLFKRSKTKTGVVTITAYDQMRYLKNKDTYVFSDLTASEIFSRICSDFVLEAEVVSPSSYVVAPRVHDNKNLFEIIRYSIDETLINSGNWYLIRDNFGKLQFVSINSLKTDLFIGDASLLTNYDYSSSIDDDSYNQIKLIKENKESQKREVYIVKDSGAIKQWGLLQYFESMEEDANEAQIQERANQLLKLKNREVKKIKLDALGDLRVFAGAGVVVGISDLEKEGLETNQYFMVNKCTHNFSNDLHTMQLELQVSI